MDKKLLGGVADGVDPDAVFWENNVARLDARPTDDQEVAGFVILMWHHHVVLISLWKPVFWVLLRIDKLQLRFQAEDKTMYFGKSFFHKIEKAVGWDFLIKIMLQGIFCLSRGAKIRSHSLRQISSVPCAKSHIN